MKPVAWNSFFGVHATLHPCEEFGLEMNLLTYSMEQSPWAANGFAASEDIPRISRNPKVSYRTHKHSPPVYTEPAQFSTYTHIPPPGDTS